jgi:hypothetical protein
MEQFIPLRQHYLDRIIRHDACLSLQSSESDILCSRCSGKVDEILRCTDCLVSSIMCSSCILEVHKFGDIYHRLEVSTTIQFLLRIKTDSAAYSYGRANFGRRIHYTVVDLWCASVTQTLLAPYRHGRIFSLWSTQMVFTRLRFNIAGAQRRWTITTNGTSF